MSNSSPFDWRTSVTSTPAVKEKSWSADQAQVGDLGVDERLVVEPRLLRVARQQRHGGLGLGADQLLERVREELGALAGGAEAGTTRRARRPAAPPAGCRPGAGRGRARRRRRSRASSGS